MKRALTLIAIIGICLTAFLAVRGAMPFMPVFGNSMEPELRAGSLILISKVDPTTVKEGDIIVYGVPAAIRDYYNYPAIVAHRVIEVRDTEFGIAWRTKGDNTGEDPFTVRTQDLKGTVSRQISFLGFPMLFLQSQQGLIFILIALGLFAFYLYANDLSRGGQKVHRGLFAPVIEESQQTTRVLSERLETSEKTLAGTQHALTSFASAIAEYAEHLKSHTSAIQGLSEASQELKRGAAEQNKVLERLAEVLEQKTPVKEEAIPETKPVKHEVKRVSFPPGCARSQPPHPERERIFGAS